MMKRVISPPPIEQQEKTTGQTPPSNIKGGQSIILNHSVKKLMIVLDSVESDHFPPIEFNPHQSSILGYSVLSKRDQFSISGDSIGKGNKN